MSRPTATPTRRVARARRAGVGLVAALALGLLSACGGDDGGDTGATATETSAAQPTTGEAAPTSETGAASPEASAQTITATEGEMYIRLSEESVSAGSVSFEVVNEGSFPHSLVVEQGGEDVATSDIVQPGGSTTLTVDLQAGDYVLYCSVGNHREMGMELPITVS